MSDPFMDLLRLQQRTKAKVEKLQRKLKLHESVAVEAMQEAARAIECANEAIDHLQKEVERLRAKNNQLLAEIVVLEVSIDLRDRPSLN